MYALPTGAAHVIKVSAESPISPDFNVVTLRETLSLAGNLPAWTIGGYPLLRAGSVRSRIWSWRGTE